jgi:gluconate 2-dehydrogenase gamma chain
MSNSQAEDYSRRDLLRHIGTSLMMGAAGEYVLAAQDVQHVHQAVADEKTAAKGKYTPKALNAHEYATLQRLSDLIIPADEHSPGALAANAADFIDFLCSGSDEMKLIYTGGLFWLDEAMKHRHSGKDFLGATAAQQTALLDLIAFRENRRGDANLGPGIDFFTWARKMVVDAFYTSPIGIKDLGYLGNTALTHFSVPQEALDYAIKRSPFA